MRFRFSGLEKCPIVVQDKPALAGKARQLKAEHPEMTQAIAKAVGCSRVNVTKALNVTSGSIRTGLVTSPGWLIGKEAKADFRKLSPDLQSQVISRTISLNRACVLSGNAIPSIVSHFLDNQ